MVLSTYWGLVKNSVKFPIASFRSLTMVALRRIEHFDVPSISTLLRKLGTYSRKNRLYLAFRELGRVVRTAFLLQYLSDADLRQTIHAATNKSEAFNRFIRWVFFGGEGLIASNNRTIQRKRIK